MPFTNPIIAGLTLIRTAIQSPDYVAGVSGWSIKKDGTVEFNNGTFRGTINAGNGNVVINSTGIIVTGSSSRTIIQPNAFSIENVPNNGQSTVLSPGLIILLPPTPTPVNHVGLTFGYIFGNNALVSGDEFPNIQIKAPTPTGTPANCSITAYGRSTNSAVGNSRIDLQSDTTVYFNGVDMGWGIVSVADTATSSAAIGNTETVILTTPAYDYSANRAYSVTISGAVTASVANNTPSFRIRKTNAAGQQFNVFRTNNVTTSAGGAGVSFTAYFTTSAAVNSVQICCTLTGGAAFNATFAVAAASPGALVVQDVGTASSFPSVGVLV